MCHISQHYFLQILYLLSNTVSPVLLNAVSGVLYPQAFCGSPENLLCYGSTQRSISSCCLFISRIQSEGRKGTGQHFLKHQQCKVKLLSYHLHVLTGLSLENKNLLIKKL